MKWSIATAFSLAILVTGQEVSPPAPSKFCGISGTRFVIDGQTGYFAGTNAYWLIDRNDTEIDSTMLHFQQAGLKVVRTWGFLDVHDESQKVWLQSFVNGGVPRINTGLTGLQRLDYVVHSAERHGIKLLIAYEKSPNCPKSSLAVNFPISVRKSLFWAALPKDHGLSLANSFFSLANNWEHWGGMRAYTEYYRVSHNEWYHNEEIQRQYQAYIEAVVSRYSESSAIFAWELANESRCDECHSDTIYNWANTTSAYIKTLDRNHMVALGDDGFNSSLGDGTYPYRSHAGIDFTANLNISTLDFGTFHLYPRNFQVDDVEFAQPWIEDHGRACVAAGKPCLLEEYGHYADNKAEIEAPWQLASLATPGIAGDLSWQWGEDFVRESNHDDYTIYYNSGTNYDTVVAGHVVNVKSSGR